ncbi:divergent polysaccharide deacetylase family protein [Caminibacter sp.]
MTSYILLQKNVKKEIQKQQNLITSLERKISKLEKETKKPKTTQIAPPSESYDYQLALKNQKETSIIQKIEKPVIKQHKSKKPMLVIILDDVSFKYQVRDIKSLPFKITPSFFPPTKRHPNTAVYAKEFSDYMVHLPLEAIHFSKPEPNTLNVGASYAKIKARIDYIKKIFPRAHFINNHTGSTFTADKNSMILLFKALKADNLGFVDSRTTPYSKAYIADNYYKIPLFSRNVFIDNKPDIAYIQNQLKKAVKIAQKKGYAIAIGHPHKTTFEALRKSKNILKNVEVVYIDELAKYTDK